ncbi:hypothetical protein PSTG_08048 [Puccinia striiformis f. sp. tritici PST-78]|uniref:Uncharacterized protein n=1 Tax=Puccinia striiformis f. sp. tritici PST-78 TaxID=1165861 RepID=A0A0L0VI56_9BASI|nr:hypothetical protein PSTG_08048 [Puccinia striiformis f. sp. tritici PST-78]
MAFGTPGTHRGCVHCEIVGLNGRFRSHKVRKVLRSVGAAVQGTALTIQIEEIGNPRKLLELNIDSLLVLLQCQHSRDELEKPKRPNLNGRSQKFSQYSGLASYKGNVPQKGGFPNQSKRPKVQLITLD